MSLTAKARELEEDYGLLPDPTERFQYLIDQSAAAPGLPPEDRCDAHRVEGCVSAVWLTAELRDGCIHYHSDGDAPIVKALAWILEDFYSGAPPAEVAATAPDFLGKLGLDRALTENRRRGLMALIARYQGLALQAMAER